MNPPVTDILAFPSSEPKQVIGVDLISAKAKELQSNSLTISVSIVGQSMPSAVIVTIYSPAAKSETSGLISILGVFH